MKFADLRPNPSLLRVLSLRGYENPTTVQQLILSPNHCHRDLLVSSRTGSGKTIAFGLALASELLGEKETFSKTSAPLALVVAPTRELALQVQTELSWLYKQTGAKVCACVGGMDIRRELRALKEGAHLVVGTPGRLRDHLERGSLDLSLVQIVVLDEADEMLDMGFREELEQILSSAPVERRTLLFSATIPREIEQLAARYQNQAERLVATPPEQAHQDIEYRAHWIVPREREHAVVNTLRFYEPSRALVFCSTREGVNHLAANLMERGFSAVATSGELTQAERVRALTALRDGRARVLVATDVAARGLDLPELELVIHADLPRDEQILQHRSGRTGRAGRKGTSVLLIPVRARMAAQRMFKAARIKPCWSPVASQEEILKLDRTRLTQEMVSLIQETSEEEMAIAELLLAKCSPEQLVCALVRQHRSKLPAPEELFETARLAVLNPKESKSRKKEEKNRKRRKNKQASKMAKTPNQSRHRSCNAL